MSSTVPAIFKNPLQQEEFDKNGFVKITLLDKNDVEELRNLFTKYFPNPSQDFFSSSYENDFPLKKEISDAIGKIILPRLEASFTNYKWFGSAFLSKGNGPRSEMPMHQDWTIVDETKYIALNIWTPLQDTNENNGTLEVIKGSHKWHNALRAPTLPFYFNGFQNQLMRQLTAIPTLATEAVVLNQAVIHYSKPNTTGNMRVAITTGIKTAEAPMIFHYWTKEKPDLIEKFSQEDDFLIRFTDFHQSIFKRPDLGISMGLQPFSLKLPTQEEINQLSRNKNNPVARLSPQSDSSPIKAFSKKIIEWIRR